MSAAAMLRHAADILADRSETYGDAREAMATIAARWSLTLGHPVTPAQVVLCMMDLKLTPASARLHPPGQHGRPDRLHHRAA
ncbi:MAG: DUF6378 domain-containing protein [Geminicoccaceae bacterium]